MKYERHRGGDSWRPWVLLTLFATAQRRVRTAVGFHLLRLCLQVSIMQQLTQQQRKKRLKSVISTRHDLIQHPCMKPSARACVNRLVFDIEEDIEIWEDSKSLSWIWTDFALKPCTGPLTFRKSKNHQKSIKNDPKIAQSTEIPAKSAPKIA